MAIKQVESDLSAPTSMADLHDIGAELAGAFERLIRSFPSDARTVAGMARHLGIGRTPCQRIALALRAKADPVRVIERFPGVRGVSQFLSAAAARHADESALEEAARAFERYVGLIGEAGGSQARLMSRIQDQRKRDEHEVAHDVSVPASGDLDRAARMMFEAARAVTRLWCDARIELRFIRPIPADPGMIEALVVFVYVGVESLDGALALIRSRSARKIKEQGVDDCTDLNRPLAPGVVGDVVLPAFSSDLFAHIGQHPRPVVTSRSTGFRRVRVFNPDGALDGRLDMAIANVRSPVCPHPVTLDPAYYGDNTTIRFPTRHLIIDAYLERSLAAQSIPNAAVLRTGEAQYTEASLDDCWYDALSIEPPLIHLGRGVGMRPSPVYPRLRELSRKVVQDVGWDDTEFVGHRLDVAFPFWQTAYCIGFDFNAPRPAPPAPRVGLRG